MTRCEQPKSKNPAAVVRPKKICAHICAQANTVKGRASVIKPKVLFLCTANSCRSQMAEAFLRYLAGQQFDSYSAGATPTCVHPDAASVMNEVGIDISEYRSKDSKEFFGQRFQFVIKVCDQATERCMIFPGALWTLEWNVSDPAAFKGTEAERLALFRQVRDDIETRVQKFIIEHS